MKRTKEQEIQRQAAALGGGSSTAGGSSPSSRPPPQQPAAPAPGSGAVQPIEEERFDLTTVAGRQRAHAAARAAAANFSEHGAQDFDRDFEQYLIVEEAKRRKKKWNYAKAFGGAAVAASSGAFFGIPLAAMVFLGAAGAGFGYRLNRSGWKGMSEEKLKALADEEAQAHSPRRRYATHKRFLQANRAAPTLKRVRFLIKWAQIKLDEIEEGDHPGVIQLMDDVVSEFSLVVEAAKTSLSTESERVKLLCFVRFLEKIRVYKKFAQANQVWLKSWEESAHAKDVKEAMVLPSDAWLRLQFVFPTIINIAKILSAHEEVNKKNKAFGCAVMTASGGSILNAIDHLADWCYSVLSMKRVKRFLQDYEDVALQKNWDQDSDQGTIGPAGNAPRPCSSSGSGGAVESGVARDDEPVNAGQQAVLDPRDNRKQKETTSGASFPTKPGAGSGLSASKSGKQNNASFSSIPSSQGGASDASAPDAVGANPSTQTTAPGGSSLGSSSSENLTPQQLDRLQRVSQATSTGFVSPLPAQRGNQQGPPADDEGSDYFPPEGAEDEFQGELEEDEFLDAESYYEDDEELQRDLEELNAVMSPPGDHKAAATRMKNAGGNGIFTQTMKFSPKDRVGLPLSSGSPRSADTGLKGSERVVQRFTGDWKVMPYELNAAAHSPICPCVLTEAEGKNANSAWSNSFSIHQVRGPNYLADKKKIPAGLPLSPTLCLDLCSSEKDVLCYYKHPDGYAQHFRRAGEGRFLFVINFRFAPKQAVSVHALSREEYEDPLFQKFLALPAESKSKRFKLIPSIVEGPWLARTTVPTKPALVATKIKSEWFQGPDFVEVSIDIFSSSAARAILGVVISATKKLVVELGFLIEAQLPEELPEKLLMGWRAWKMNLDASAIRDLKPAPSDAYDVSDVRVDC
ncbi:unnamed protein product [Amoebophrya sp. A25]|nr:unnamed protein product [Amoebophrya sp. A25]|eukprot:GSA25T00007644001.1